MNDTPYTPPAGYYDLPYTYAFDASGLTDGLDYPNQSIYIKGGYGDFLLRRVVGLNRILNPNGTGRFQIGRASPDIYMESAPVQGANTPELPIVPGELYPETGKIWFDLFGLLKPGLPLTAQLAFQGIRRLKGNVPVRPKYNPKSYTYQVQATLTQQAGSPPVITKTAIVDYDFELHQIMIFDQLGPSSCGGTPPITVSTDVCSLGVFDQNTVQISNLPILDRFFNGAPGSPYENGAVVPPLFFRKDSILEIDVYSQILGSGNLPATVTIYLIGKKLYPCS